MRQSESSQNQFHLRNEVNQIKNFESIITIESSAESQNKCNKPFCGKGRFVPALSCQALDPICHLQAILTTRKDPIPDQLVKL